MGVVISKESFVKALKEMQEVEDFCGKLNAFFRDNDVEGYLFPPDCSVTVENLLHEIFGTRDRDEWISYFIYDLDFGRGYCSGTIRDENGEDIKLDTAEALYDFLVEQEDRGE